MTQQGEAKFVNDWLAQYHPTALQWKRIRLGPLPNVELAKMYEVTLRWVDAIFIENESVHLVEAKLVNQLAGIAQLELYAKLFRDTPEFSAYKNMPIVSHLVAPRTEPEVKRMCAEKGIIYEVYTPAWYTPYRA